MSSVSFVIDAVLLWELLAEVWSLVRHFNKGEKFACICMLDTGSAEITAISLGDVVGERERIACIESRVPVGVTLEHSSGHKMGIFNHLFFFLVVIKIKITPLIQ